MQKREFLNKLAQIAVPAVFGLSLGNGVYSFVQEKNYAITQITFGAIGLGLWSARQFEVKHKKTIRVLNNMFKNIDISRTDIVKQEISFSFGMGLICREYKFKFPKMISDKFKDNMQLVLDGIAWESSVKNREEGLGIREAVLKSIAEGVEEVAPDFKKRDCEYYLRSFDIYKIFFLKMCQEIYNIACAAKSDEKVFEFFYKGFENEESPFYGIKVRPEALEHFVNRSLYEMGDKNLFLALDGVKAVAWTSMLATAAFLPVTPVTVLASFSVAGLTYLDNRLRREHVLKQDERFETEFFKLKDVNIKNIERFFDDTFVWEEEGAILTSYGKACLDEKCIKDVMGEVEKSPFDTAKELGFFLFAQLILNDKKMSDCYKGIEQGLTLEQVTKKYGVSSVYEMMCKKRLIKKTSSFLNQTKKGILFCLNNDLVEARKALEESKKKADSFGKDEFSVVLNDILKKTYNVEILKPKEMELQTEIIHVETRVAKSDVKLPRMVQKMLKTHIKD